MGGEEVSALFKEKAAAVQAVVSMVSDVGEALAYAVDLTAGQGGTVIAAPGWDGPHFQALADLAAARGLTALNSGLRDRARGLHTGLTWADWGVAETGTLVCDSTDEDYRLATMLVNTHVAILPASRLRGSLMELGPELVALQGRTPRYLACISGASRTADIERVLTIGVHGPEELHILILAGEDDHA